MTKMFRLHVLSFFSFKWTDHATGEGIRFLNTGQRISLHIDNGKSAAPEDRVNSN